MMLAAKFAIALVASSLVSAQSPPDCKHANGYKYSKCGKGDSETCCNSLSKCVTVKPKTGSDLATCSEDRQLSNTKAVKIVIAPLFFLLMDVALIAFLVLRCDGAKSPTTMVCVVVLGTAWPFLFSKFWTLGVYTILLAALVACAAAGKDLPSMPGWTYRLIWALTILQIVAFLGPMETFHVPIYDKSKGSNTEFIANIYKQDECNTYYLKYFKILDIEKKEKDANPDINYGGYCSEGWLAALQGFGVVQSILWMGLSLVSARDLLSISAGSGKTSVVVP